MKLRVGERLPGSGPAEQPGGYVVTQVIHETPWQGLYAGKKIFYNFDFTAKRPRETDEKEWLGVFLRTIQYPHPDDPAYVAGRRALAQAEASRVLGSGTSNLWPEPVDVLEVPNTQDRFSFADVGDSPALAGLEPILVFERPSGVLLSEWRNSPRPAGSILGILAELLDFIETAGKDGVVLNGLGPASVLVDSADRVHYLATDMALDAVLSNGSRKYFPVERYPVGYTPPEYYDAGYRPNGRGDLYSWGCIAYSLLANDDPREIALEQRRFWGSFQEEHFTGIEKTLRSIPPAHVRNWAEQLQVSGEELERHWPDNVVTVLQRVLSRWPQNRPANVRQLKDWLISPPASPVIEKAEEAPSLDDSVLRLPPSQAADQLWEAVLYSGDPAAHRRLLEVVAELPIAVDPLPSGLHLSPHPYVASLERHLASPDYAGRPLPRLQFDNAIQCIQAAGLADSMATVLVQSSDDRVRELGRELVVIQVRGRLEGIVPQAADIRRELDTACAVDVPEEKVLVCRRLAEVGLDAAAVRECLLELQDERLTGCTECAARVRIRDVTTHLRRGHGIFEFRGVRRSFHDTRAILLDAVCGPAADHAAWRTLEEIARDRHGGESGRRLVVWLTHKLKVLAREQRATALRSLAEAIVAAGSHDTLFNLLAERMKVESQEVMSRVLALEILVALRPPVAYEMVATSFPLLNDRRLSRETRRRAVAALLKTTGPSGDAADVLLRAYVEGNGKLRALDKLRNLEQQVGPMPAIESLCLKLEDQVRMHCPRCAIELQRAQMVRHLWDNHRLVLDGRRVREPWRLIEDWIEDYRLEKDEIVLAQCRELANRLEGEEGAARLERLLLQHGIDDPQAIARLRNEARKNNATLCPHCFDLVAMPSLSRPAVVHETDERLEAGGYTLEVAESGFLPWVEVEGPRGTLFEGKQQGRGLTRNGFLIGVMGPLVLAVFLIVLWLTGSQLAAVLGIGLGVFTTGLVYVFWPTPPTPRDNLVDLAWAHLVPKLHARGFDEGDSAVVAGLAALSIGYGRVEKRDANLETLRTYTEAGVRKHETCLPHLGALWRLTAEDARDAEEDGAAIIAQQFERCFSARQPLSYAAAILARCQRPGEESPRSLSGWSKGEVARLHVLACERAFQHGLDPEDLIELGRCEPALTDAMRLHDLPELSQLFLLWKLRGERPWEKVGEARTVFELAAELPADNPSTIKLLGEVPDLLWITSGSPRLCVCARGVFFEDTLITHLPDRIEIVARTIIDDEGYDLVIGPNRFRFSYEPDRLAKRIEAWLRHYFREFLPQVRSLAKRSRDGLRKIQTQNSLVCPECRRLFLPRLADVGLAAEERSTGEKT